MHLEQFKKINDNKVIMIINASDIEKEELEEILNNEEALFETAIHHATQNNITKNAELNLFFKKNKVLYYKTF